MFLWVILSDLDAVEFKWTGFAIDTTPFISSESVVLEEKQKQDVHFTSFFIQIENFMEDVDKQLPIWLLLPVARPAHFRSPVQTAFFSTTNAPLQDISVFSLRFSSKYFASTFFDQTGSVLFVFLMTLIGESN